MAKLTEVAVRDERRCADASIRGYLYQVCLGVERWLDLAEGETLLLEGDEDLDRLVLADAERICEQVKYLASDLGFRDKAIADSIVNFVSAFAEARQEGEQRRFVFTSNAARRQSGEIDPALLSSWHDPDRQDEVISAIRAVAGEKAASAIAWLDGDSDRWQHFIAAVDWRLEEGGIDQVVTRIRDRLHDDERTGHLDAGLLADRLVTAVLQASAAERPGLRLLDRDDLARVIATTTTELERWARTPKARRLRTVMEELQGLQTILHPGTLTLTPQLLNPGRLLQAAYQVVPFVEPGRRIELERLAGWCTGPAQHSVWLLTGVGGTGKTRLMIEWCRRLAGQGWHTGFLVRDVPDLGPLLSGTTPRLCVIDYAETRLPEVRTLLRRMSTLQTGPKLRLVLLARTTADWWRQLALEDQAVADLIDSSPTPYQVPFLVTQSEDRLDLFHQARNAFAVTLGYYSAADEPESTLPGGPVLYLYMAALASLLGDRVPAPDELLDAILDHEQRFWLRQLESLGEADAECTRSAIAPVAATLTLVGGSADRQRAEQWARTVAGHLTPQLVHITVSLLHRLYTGDQTGAEPRWLGVVDPDLLGEHLVDREIKADLLDTIIGLADEAETLRALTVLTRLAARNPQQERLLATALAGRTAQLAGMAIKVAIETGDPIGKLLAEAIKAAADPDLARNLESQLPWPTVALREAGAAVTAILLDDHRKSATEDEESAAELARLATNLGVRLSELGRREEALIATQEAVDVFRSLAAGRPDKFLPFLATSLSNLGNRFSKLGHHEKALTSTQESVQIRHTLAKGRPGVFLPDLAGSMNNLSVVLSGLDRHKALAAAQKAVEIFRSLAADRPTQFLPALANSLLSLGNRLSELGSREEALTASKETVEIYRSLTENESDRYLPDLAMSLTTLGTHLSELGRHKVAVTATKEAVEILRRLAESRPAAFLPDLAMALNNIGGSLWELGHREEALALIKESVGIRRQLSADDPGAFLPDLAMSLCNLGAIGPREESLAASFEAVEIYRHMVASHPALFYPISLCPCTT